MGERPDGVLLDLDGTLVDHAGAAARAVAEWAADLPNWDADISAAHEAGLRALHLDRGRFDPPPGTVASLADAAELLF